MKITFTGKIPMTSRGIAFNEGEYDIPSEDAKYLAKTFPGKFTLVEVVVPKPASRPKKDTTKAPKATPPKDEE